MARRYKGRMGFRPSAMGPRNKSGESERLGGGEGLPFGVVLPNLSCQSALMAEMEMLWRLADAAAEAGDFERARVLYERGAALGDPACWAALGYMFDIGQGAEPDKQKAMRFYRVAWRRKNIMAANTIAVLYRERGGRRAMFRWFLRAAEHGDDGAYLELAKCYRDGFGVHRSLTDVVKCASKVLAGQCASDFDREEAQNMLEAYRPRSV